MLDKIRAPEKEKIRENEKIELDADLLKSALEILQKTRV